MWCENNGTFFDLVLFDKMLPNHRALDTVRKFSEVKRTNPIQLMSNTRIHLLKIEVYL
jgi:hypothetical protein